jgi:two-component system response regulator FixJ
MPGISSLELHTPLRERGVDIPIILLTDLRLIAVTATRKGAVDFIEKPFDKVTLVSGGRQTFARYDEPAGNSSNQA